MEKVAFHEAGHAVVAWSLGARPTRIYLDLEKQGGEVISAVEPTRLCIVQQIAFHYAGPVSEEIFKGPASSRRALADHVNGNILLKANGTPEEEPEGQALQIRAYAPWSKNCCVGTRPGLGGSPSACCSRRTK